MGFVETELHKLHLRVEALEDGRPAHLEPADEVEQNSTLKIPTSAPEAVATEHISEVEAEETEKEAE
jgi:hypothetical protein